MTLLKGDVLKYFDPTTAETDAIRELRDKARDLALFIQARVTPSSTAADHNFHNAIDRLREAIWWGEAALAKAAAPTKRPVAVASGNDAVYATASPQPAAAVNEAQPRKG